MTLDLLTAAIEDYLLALEAEGRAPATLRIYEYALRRLASHAGPIAPAQCTPTLLRSWLKAMADEGLPVTSQRDYLRAVKSWISWLVAWHPCGSGPIRTRDQRASG